MTPKEKAKELMLKYYDLIEMSTVSFSKQCALIAVDELIKETGAKYWYDVKQEIQEL
jgi:hypothetical protein